MSAADVVTSDPAAGAPASAACGAAASPLAPLPVPRELAEVAFYWYNALRPAAVLPMGHVEEVWINRWFAKGAQQAVMDKELRMFEPLLVARGEPAAAAAAAGEPTDLCEQMGYIVLFDQVPRNIYRGTPRAYAYDHLSYALAKRIFSTPSMMERLPFHMRCTVLICLVHSESLADQEAIHAYVRDEKALPQTLDLVARLRGITESHRDRIAMFGRFPERNAILGRESTADEAAFMAGIYVAAS